MADFQRVSVIDSHTGGEPTRVVIAGGPDFGVCDMAARREMFRERFDHFRTALMNEPRGWDALVGAILCKPVSPESASGVIFFNNVGYLGMCVHGTMGVVVTLAHLGRLQPGTHQLETPVGTVAATLHDDGHVSVRNVPSFRLAKNICVPVEGYGDVTGDIAWGGNWFFLVDSWGTPPGVPDLYSGKSGDLPLAGTPGGVPHIEQLTDFTWAIRQALVKNNITGAGGAEIDHIELFGPPTSSAADCKNFVLCPGKAYDRSPCGTGTSAKLACLVADGKLPPGQVWRQESIVGSIFEGTGQLDPISGGILPTIKGSAFITAESTLMIDARDPFGHGIH